MIALIDYDNLPEKVLQGGARFCADKLHERLQAEMLDSLASESRLDLRLYGGWHTQTTPSQRALALQASIVTDFPLYRVRDNASRFTVNATLAESLLALPHQTLPHTFRSRSEPPHLRLSRLASSQCTNPRCLAKDIDSLISNKICPIQQCARPITDFIFKAEQKLVDTMLVADLIFLASTTSAPIVIVSSDDDLWPGMLAAMQLNRTVIHVTTKYPSTERLYLGSLRHRYTTISL